MARRGLLAASGLSGTGVPVPGSGCFDSGDLESGLRLQGGGSTVRGLAISSFPCLGIRIASNGNVIEGNFIGLGAGGTAAGLGNGSGGIGADGTTDRGNTNGVYLRAAAAVGDGTAAGRNVISGGSSSGLHRGECRRRRRPGTSSVPTRAARGDPERFRRDQPLRPVAHHRRRRRHARWRLRRIVQSPLGQPRLGHGDGGLDRGLAGAGELRRHRRQRHAALANLGTFSTVGGIEVRDDDNTLQANLIAGDVGRGLRVSTGGGNGPVVVLGDPSAPTPPARRRSATPATASISSTALPRWCSAAPARATATRSPTTAARASFSTSSSGPATRCAATRSTTTATSRSTSATTVRQRTTRPTSTSVRTSCRTFRCRPTPTSSPAARSSAAASTARRAPPSTSTSTPTPPARRRHAVKPRPTSAAARSPPTPMARSILRSRCRPPLPSAST